MIAQSRLERRDVERLDLDMRGHESVDAALDAVRIIETLEHILRAEFETFALLHDLVQDLETRTALRELALQRVQLLHGRVALAAQLVDGIRAVLELLLEITTHDFELLDL